jgi:Tol biopolymer transport system component
LYDAIWTSQLRVLDADGSNEHVVAEWAPPADEEESGAAYLRPAWSPSGKWIALDASGQLVLVDSASGARRATPELPHAIGGYAWSPSTDTIAFTSDYGKELWRLDVGGVLRRLVPTGRFEKMFSPAWAPDGSAIAFAGCPQRREEDEVGTCDIFTTSSDGTGLRRVTRTPGADGPLTWSR